MGRAFNGAATDKLKTTNYAGINNLTTLTIGMWVYRVGAGGSGFGRMVDKRNLAAVGAAAFYMYANNSTQDYEFVFTRWSTSDGAWVTNANSAVTGTLHHVLVTYDASSTSNDATWYIDGATVAQAETSAPTGSLNSETTDVCIGNRDNGDRNFDGALADVAIWNRVLTPGEIASIAVKGFSPLFYPNGLVLYYPLWEHATGTQENFGMNSPNHGTLTGTVVAEPHPQIIYPFKRRQTLYKTITAPPGGLVGSGLTTGKLLSRPSLIGA